MSNLTETNQERQDNEFQALQAIFGSELVDLRKSSAWNEWVKLEMKITLLPQQGSSGLHEKHSQIDLHVKCTAEYPDLKPIIILENPRGLSNELVKILHTELDQMAQRHVGEVMIFDLTQHVNTFLHEHTTKPEYESFWDEMYGRQEKQKQQILQAKQIKEDQEQRKMKNEIERRQELLRTEPRIHKEQRRTSESDTTILNPAIERARSYSRKRYQSASESSEGSQCEHRGTKLFTFANKGERQVIRGRCISHSERGSTVYAGLDTTTGESLAVIEWQMKIKNQKTTPRDKKLLSPQTAENHELSQCMKFIGNMEHELNFLMKLRHKNLVNYLNIKYIQENDTVYVYILQELVMGLPLSTLYYSDNFMMECDMLRYIAEEILNAIDFLHKNNVLHRDIRSSTVFIDKNGVMKVSDYSLSRRLYEFASHQAHHKNYTKKTDIYHFGILMLSLLRGVAIDENEKQPKIPMKIPSELRDFISKCLVQDERNRFTSTQLLKHNFIRARMERMSPARTLDTTQSGDGNSDQYSEKNGENGDDDSHDNQHLIPVQIGEQSRLQIEFEIIKWLGRGAFGDVLKVRNRLDGGCYAIKRIRLNPNNKQLNKKITREVKLLSRLNHENVVRYYNSWIESATVETTNNDEERTEDDEGNTGNDQTDLPIKKKDADLEQIVNDMDKKIFHGVEWSVSYESKSKPNPTSPIESSDEDSSDDDDDDDDEDDWITSPFKKSDLNESSDSIEFERDSENVTPEQQSIESQSPTSSTRPPTATATTPSADEADCKKCGVNFREIQFMYIQMEFCEKSTLRIAIDKGLYKDVDRVWRLFREIVEGLSHIHQQGMIHRDLKPVNIFLDSNDHVKIGDFGLATSNILPRTNTELNDVIKSNQDLKNSHNLELQLLSAGAGGDGSLTSKVGTALYVAPELNTKTSKAIYNQKVDIYSLGIILFEMAYAPLSTKMERVVVLANLRTKDIVFPRDFSESQYTRYVTVIRWLLNHDPSQRPTAQELLQSEHIPPPQIEENELQDLLRRTLANTQSKAYKYLISSCFDQIITPAEDITYDMNYSKNTLASDRPVCLIENVKECITRIFKLHGGRSLTTPLLLPKSVYYDGIESCVRLMTRSGTVVSLPHDLRVPFARYVARNNINHMKRYSIERVYRERKIHGFQPRELYECAFDIITPTPGNLTAEAELLSIVYELVQQFPALKDKNIGIRLNHTALLKAALLNCGIGEEKHEEIHNLLADVQDGKLSRLQLQTHLISLCLNDEAITQVKNLIDAEISPRNHTTYYHLLTKKKPETGTLARRAFNDLNLIIQNTEALGVKCNITICPGLVYNLHQHSGMMCQFVCELKKKRRKGDRMDVIAAGGRYDKMLNSFRTIFERTGMLSTDGNQSGVGISISLEKLVHALQEDDTRAIEPSPIDVLVCAIGDKSMTREKCAIVRDLWSAGIRCTLIDTNSVDEINEQRRELNVAHNIILKENEQGTVLIHSWERDRFQERRVNIPELVEYMQRLIRTWNDSTNDSSVVNISLTRSESRENRSSSFNEGSSPASMLPNSIVRFITSEKLAANARRRHENLILTQLSTKLQRLSRGCRVEIIAMNIEAAVVRTMTSYVDAEAETNLRSKIICSVIEKHPRHKKYLLEIFDEVFELLSEKNCVIVFYSLLDSYYRILL